MSTLSCQRELFDLEPGDGFLNGAYMSPQLKAVHAAGVHALARKNRPSGFQAADFFEPIEELKKLYARLIDCPDAQRIVPVPSVSYGLANVAVNLPLAAGQNIVLPSGQFPSNYYSWSRLCKERGGELRLIDCPANATDRGAAWTEAILAAIDQKTVMVACGHIHWADGSLFDLAKLRVASRQVGAWLVIDGTQSVGALPFSIQEFEPDALVCAGYKWLMGPYSTALAYYGPALDAGRPIEDNWINRRNSQDFKNLVNYQEHYRDGASRYAGGQHSNFVFLPMQMAGLQQLLSWTPTAIQAYCRNLWAAIAPGLTELGIHLASQRAEHLVGLRLPEHFASQRLPEELSRRKLTVSFRGDAIRVSPHLYNRRDEMMRLLEALRAIAQ